MRPQRKPRGTSRRTRSFSGGLESLEPRVVLSVAIQFDYSYDNTGFFAPGTAARAILEQAGSYIGSHLNDHLAAIPGNPGAGNTWSARPLDPRDINSTLNLTNLAVPADTIIVYAGASALPTGITGQGATGAYMASGSASWTQLIGSRGQTNALTTPRADTGPWGGAITFSTSVPFSFTPMGTPSGNGTDFLATALQELGHVLGLVPGTPDYGLVDSATNTFLGAHAVASYGGPVPLDASDAYWADGTQSFGSAAIMDPSASTYPQGAKYTSLDWAGLEDAGWETDALSISTPPPSSVTAGHGFGLTVAALDPNGRVDKAYNGPITLSLASNPGGATLGGTLTVDAVNGVAVFSNLTLNKSGSGYTLSAAASGLSTATTNGLGVVSAAAATFSIATVPPTSLLAGNPFSMTVTALDAFGNVATGFSGAVTLALSSNPGLVVLGGTLSAGAVNGVATFSNLTIDRPASGTVIGASASGLGTVASAPITTSYSQAPTIKFQFDYTYDTSGFFANNPAAKAALEQAAAIIGNGLHDTLSAIVPDPAAGNNWSVSFISPSYLSNPGSFGTPPSFVTVNNPTVAANTLLVYVAGFASPAGGYSYASSSGSGYSNGGSSDWITNIQSRGQAGALGANATDVAPWGGMLAFGAGSNWSFAGTGGTPGAGQIDFLTVAEHLLVGLLGFGGSTPWKNDVNAANHTFVGPHASASNGGPVPLATNNNGVWASGLSSNGQEPLMEDGFTSGQRRGMTSLDWAGLADIGWMTDSLAVTTQPPANVTAGAPFGMQVTVVDPNGNKDASFNGPVTLSLGANPNGLTLGGTLTVNAVGGVATFSGLTLDRSGTGETILASSSLLSAVATTPLFSSSLSTTAATQLAITAQPPTGVKTAEGFSMTVTAKDANGNVATNYSGPITLSLATNPGNGQLGGTLTVNAVYGIATFTGLTLNASASGYLIKASASGLSVATSTAITVTPAATQLAITTQPAGVKTGQGFSLTVTAKDANGNVDPNYSGPVTLSLAANPGYGLLGGTLTIQAVNGLATFTGLTLNEPASGYLIKASSSGLSDATTSAITVTSAGPQLAITTQPASMKTEEGFSLTVTAKDANGNFDPTYSGLITLSLVANPGNGRLGGTLTAHAVSGVANFTGLTLNRLGVGYRIRASASGLTDATSSSITVTPAATQLAITTQPPSSVNPAAGFSLTVTAEVANGTVDLDYTGPITLSLANNPGDGMLSGTLTVNAVHGVATFTGLSLNKSASGYLIKASASGLMETTSTAIHVMPVATQLAFLGSGGATAMVDFSLSTMVVDATGQYDPYYTGLVTLSLYSNPSNGTLVGTLTAQAVNGIATFTGLTLNKVGIYRFQATATGLPTAYSSIFGVIPAATHFVITTEPPSRVKTGEGFSIAVEALDANENLDPNYSGIVKLEVVVNPSNANLSGTLTAQAVNGIATFTGLSLNKAASGYIIRVLTDSSLSPATATPITVTMASTQLAITTEPPSGVKTATGFSLTVTAKDANGDVDPNYFGPIMLSLAANPGSGMLSGTLTGYAFYGVATFTGLSLNKSASGYLIKASAPGMTSATSSAIAVTPAATQLAITAQPPSSVKTGQAFSLTVNALDANGNLDPNYAGLITLSLANNPGAGMLSGTLTVYAVHGVATFTGVSLNKSASGYLIKATSGGLTSAMSSAIAVTPAATQLAITAQPPSTVKVGVPFSLTVTAKDASGNVDPNYSGIITIGLAANPGAGMVSGTLNVQAVHGVAVFTDLILNKPAVGYLIKATSSGLTLATSSAITATTA